MIKTVFVAIGLIVVAAIGLFLYKQGEFHNLLVSATGAFIGFGLAILSNFYIKKDIERNDMEAIAAAFDDELKRNLEIAALVNERFNNSNSNKFEYAMSVWQAIIASGLLMKLYSERTTRYNGCIELYAVIDCANSLERSIELCYYSNGKGDELLRLKEKRLLYTKQIIAKINDILITG